MMSFNTYCNQTQIQTNTRNPYLSPVLFYFSGIFERYYGGSVNQGNNNQDGYLYHALRIQGSGANMIVAVNPSTCQVKFSDIVNLRHIHSLQKVS